MFYLFLSQTGDWLLKIFCNKLFFKVFLYMLLVLLNIDYGFLIHFLYVFGVSYRTIFSRRLEKLIKIWIKVNIKNFGFCAFFTRNLFFMENDKAAKRQIKLKMFSVYKGFVYLGVKKIEPCWECWKSKNLFW